MISRFGTFIIFITILIIVQGFSITIQQYIANSGVPSYSVVSESKSIFDGNIFILDLKSQVWRGIEWNHKVAVYIPKRLLYKSHAILFVTGSAPKSLADNLNQYINFAELTGAPFVILWDVPNQPLFGLKEDALIAYTLAKYFESGEEDWPILLPMVKSVVSTMDCVQDLLRKFGVDVKKFFVTGASKRGWTTYLVGAVDKRAFAIAPIVYDNLNMREQMKKQLQYYGNFSEQIKDYTKYGFTEMVAFSHEVPGIVKIIDPYYYEIESPKLIIAATNDPYWVVDSSELYFYDLKDPKYVRFIPNEGHNISNVWEVLNAIRVFFWLSINEKFPDFTWEINENGIEVITKEEVDYAKGWYALSDNLDFRKSPWKSLNLDILNRDGKNVAHFYKSHIDNPNKNIAMMVEIGLVVDGYKITLTTIPKVYKNSNVK
ncbi:MAG: PhoPQ-activated protein PqaA family protein [Fervidobacterium sp.]